MKYIFLLQFLFLLLLGNSSIGFTSAWVREEKEFFLSFTTYFQSANKYFDEKGSLRSLKCKFQKSEFQVYGEYGLDKKHTITFKLPYDILKCGSDRTTDIGDLELGIIRNLRRGESNSLSAYGNLLIPTGYSINQSPRIGYGRFAFETGVLYGLSGKWGYFDSGIGFRYYLGYPSSQLRSYVGGGVNITRNIQLLTFVDVIIGLGDGKRKVLGENIFLEPDYKLVQLNIASKISYGKISLVPGYQRVLYGKNTGVAHGFFLSIWYDF